MTVDVANPGAVNDENALPVMKCFRQAIDLKRSQVLAPAGKRTDERASPLSPLQRLQSLVATP
jgi:hypothetical protein